MTATVATSRFLRFARFELRSTQGLLLADGRPQNLRGWAFDLLQVLIECRDRVVAHDELFAHQADPATAAVFEESLRCGRRIADPWNRDFLIGQMSICQSSYQAMLGQVAAVAACDAAFAEIGGDKLCRAHGRALLGMLALRRGELDRVDLLQVERLDRYRAVESQPDFAASLSQQGHLAWRRGVPQRALALLRQSLPPRRDYPLSRSAKRGLAAVLVALAACERWPQAVRLARALAQEGDVAGAAGLKVPPELACDVQHSYDLAVAAAKAAEPAGGRDAHAC